MPWELVPVGSGVSGNRAYMCVLAELTSGVHYN
jgi:hypothetical protein